MTRLGIEQNIDVLRRAALLLEAENERLVQKNIQLTRELLALKGADASALQLKLQQLEEQLARARQKLFGDSSEKGPKAAAGATSNDVKPVQRGHGRREQPALPHVEVVHTLDEADKMCPACGGTLEEMEGQFEESEEVDVIERRFVLKKHKRLKYRCRCASCIETAPAPTKLFEAARYSVDFAIEVAVQKYLDHQPLERQVRIMGREGLAIDSQTLWDYLARLATLLAPAYAALHAYLLAQPVLGADETRWRLMGMGGDEGEAKRWQVWALAAPEAVCYLFLDSRSTEAARLVLRDFTGVLMTDGYAVYQSLAKAGGLFILVHCWAHVRREFLSIQDFFPQVEEVLGLIRELYAIEKSCPPGPEGDALRLHLRQTRSRQVVARIQAWALAQRALPQSGLGKALAYMGGLWNGLVRFLEDPRIPLDNNATERALRGVVLGRKNHYGSRSRRGTEVAALLYSLMETAKLAGLEPKQYLRLAVQAALRGEAIPLPHQLVAGTTIVSA